MRFITDSEIKALKIPYGTVIEWVREAFIAHDRSILPPKTSMTFEHGSHFVNTMSALMPTEGVYGVKVVSRYPHRSPTIQGDLLLYDLATGNPLAVLGATWITAARTGAVAALAAETLGRTGSEVIAIAGLGVTGNAFLDAYSSTHDNRKKTYRLLRHKDHARQTKARLAQAGIENVEIAESFEELTDQADIVVSAITIANRQLASPEAFRPGATLIPIHTRGFQDCDIEFDRIFGDDAGHISNFGNFNKFRYFAELSAVLSGRDPGRQSATERILSYNIGIALHDVLIANKVFRRFTDLTIS